MASQLIAVMAASALLASGIGTGTDTRSSSAFPVAHSNLMLATGNAKVGHCAATRHLTATNHRVNALCGGANFAQANNSATGGAGYYENNSGVIEWFTAAAAATAAGFGIASAVSD